MRIVYSGLLYLLLPALLLRLFWRGLGNPAYWRRWPERLGFYPGPARDTAIWLHAVSVGETESVAPLVNQLLARHPGLRLLLTTTTPTGAARARALFQGRIDHAYLPYDLPCAVGRFMRHFRPRAAVVLETEIWPNLYAHCGRHGLPLYLANARLSEKSVRGYQKIAPLARATLANLTFIAAQSQQDAERFVAIGADGQAVANIGNIKFDLALPADLPAQGQALKDALFPGRFVWLLASSHDGEESLLLAGYRRLKPYIPELLLALAPRHPRRAQAVARLCQQAGLSLETRSSARRPTARTDVFLLDTLGELKLFYQAADLALVGGSLVPVGGHNVLEPAAIGTPVMFGPHMANFREITRQMLEQNAAILCPNPDADALARQCQALYADPGLRQALAANARAFVESRQGATAKLAGLLAKHCV